VEKEILSEQFVIHGNVESPKSFEINSTELSIKILECHLTGNTFLFSKAWDMLNTYICENINLKYNINLVNKNSFGNIYLPNETTEPYLKIDLTDLKNSPDFVLLYGVDVNNCLVKIMYDNNRHAGKCFEIELKKNKFVLFTSTKKYYILNNQKDSLNFIQTILYEHRQ